MMHYGETVAATAVAVVTGLASAVVQASEPSPHPFTVPIVSAAVGGIVSFVVLKTTVKVVERDLLELKQDVKKLTISVARIEGRHGAQG